MTKMSDNLSPYLTIVEATEPSAPSAGQQRLYIDSTTHKLKATNSSGTERDIESAGGGLTAVTYIDYLLSADVTMTTGGTFYAGPTGTPAAGVWNFFYKALFAIGGNNKVEYLCKLWDGSSTIWDESGNDSVATSVSTYLIEVSGFALNVTLNGSTAVTLAAKGDQPSQTMKRDAGGTIHTVTRLSGFKVA